MPPTKWNDEQVECLIDLYREYSYLYDVNSPLYRNKTVREGAYKTIAKEIRRQFNCRHTAEGVKKKIYRLRSQYIKARTRRSANKPWWYKDMGFLKPYIQD